MKKFLIILSIFTLYFALVFGGKVSVNLVPGKYGPSLSTVFESENAKLLLNAEAESDGTIKTETPPFFSLSLEPYIKFGEIRPDGIVLQTLDPTEISTAFMGFIHNRFKNISTPALVPEYSGLVIPFGGFDIFAFSPVLNSKSPNGFGFDIGNEKLFTCFIVSDNSYLNSQTTQQYQVNWRENLGSFKSVKILAGAVSNSSFEDCIIRTQSFLHITDDITCGRAFSLGTDLKLSIKSFHFLIKKRLSHLSEKSAIQLKIGDLIKVNYSDKVFSKPIYGGQYQKRNKVFKYSINIKLISFLNEIESNITESGTKSTKETFSLKYGDKKNSITFSASLNSAKDKLEFLSWNIEANCKLAKLSFSEGKTKLSYTFTTKLTDKDEAKLTIDQDRRISVSYTYSN